MPTSPFVQIKFKLAWPNWKRCASLRVVKLDECARVKEIASQESTVPALGDNLSSHRSGNLGQPSPDFRETGGRFSILNFPFDPLDVLDSQAGAGCSGPQHAIILVYGIDLERHATLNSRNTSGHSWSCRLLSAEGDASYKFDYR